MSPYLTSTVISPYFLYTLPDISCHLTWHHLPPYLSSSGPPYATPPVSSATLSDITCHFSWHHLPPYLTSPVILPTLSVTLLNTTCHLIWHHLSPYVTPPVSSDIIRHLTWSYLTSPVSSADITCHLKSPDITCYLTCHDLSSYLTLSVTLSNITCHLNWHNHLTPYLSSHGLLGWHQPITLCNSTCLVYHLMWHHLSSKLTSPYLTSPATLSHLTSPATLPDRSCMSGEMTGNVM